MRTILEVPAPQVTADLIDEVLELILGAPFVKKLDPITKGANEIFSKIYPAFLSSSREFLGEEVRLVESLVDPKNLIMPVKPGEVIKVKPGVLRKFHREANGVLGVGLADKVVTGVQKSLTSMYALARNLVSKEIGIAKDPFSVKDLGTIKILDRDMNFWIRNAYSREISKVISEEVGNVVNLGLSHKRAAAELKRRLGTVFKETDHYWNIVSKAAVGRARNFARINRMAEYEIISYKIIAIIDHRTTPTCRYMNGRVFKVKRAKELVEKVLSSQKPTDIKAAHPWLEFSSRRAREGSNALFLRLGKTKRYLPSSTFSFSRTKGFLPAMGHRVKATNTELEDMGVMLPPFHALCRSDISISREAVREFIGRPE